jgi:hypothetical protein
VLKKLHEIIYLIVLVTILQGVIICHIVLIYTLKDFGTQFDKFMDVETRKILIFEW